MAQTILTATNDATMEADVPTTNKDTLVAIGEHNGGAFGPHRCLLKFDFSSIPVGSTIDLATLKLTIKADQSSQARTFHIYRVKRAWVDSQVTWNIWKTSNNWQTAGAGGANDYDSSSIGNRAFANNESIGTVAEFTLTNASIQAWLDGDFTNNGLMGRALTEVDEMYTFENIGDTNKPILVVDYTPPPSGSPIMFNVFGGQ